MNSALEIDMDFDTTIRPPPEPTEEGTASLEELIKRRIAEARWDDVIRIVPPPVEQKKKRLELDDGKSGQGLGEVYEADYVRAAAAAGGAGGMVVEDKQEPLRREARALFKALCGKLDALSAFHFTPKPVVEELEVRWE
jgi:U3 small nucleolar RNA-associated protein MPP10